MTATEKEVIWGSFLKDQIVAVKPVESNGKWSTLLVKGQELKKEPLMFNKVKRSFQVPLRSERNGGGIVSVLDDYKRVNIKKYHLKYPEGMTEKEFFEEELGVDLNPTKPAEQNFWRTDKRSRVTLTKEGLQLNLTFPLDMIKYKILLADTLHICPSYEERTRKATYEFMLVDEASVVSKKVEEINIKAKAYSKYSELTNNINNLKGFIKSIGRTIPVNHTEEWLKNEVATILETNPVKFLEIVNHPHYNAKIFVQEAIEVGAITKMNDKRYLLDNGVELGELTDTINYLSDPEHQEVKLRIKAKIEMSRKK